MPLSISKFKNSIWNYYKKEGRDLLWRRTTDPYRIVVSELMLQQTQVQRVISKYPEFITAFPDFASLAEAPLASVLKVWQGMGYNRRAIALHKIAKRVVGEYKGVVPKEPNILSSFPGIGEATAGSIIAFAYNIPTIFIETNIRRVYIHFFFSRKKMVKDEEIIPFIKKTVSRIHPREWYWALMDYGTMLGKSAHKIGGNPNKKSTAYRVQSKFHGSNRQIRGAILKVVLQENPITLGMLHKRLPFEPLRILHNVTALTKEGFLKQKGKKYVGGG